MATWLIFIARCDLRDDLLDLMLVSYIGNAEV